LSKAQQQLICLLFSIDYPEQMIDKIGRVNNTLFIGYSANGSVKTTLANISLNGGIYL
jgi:hypothetical protein